MAVISFSAATKLLLSKAADLHQIGSESVGLLASRGRVLATALQADRDQPAFDRSTRDGFALRAVDSANRKHLRVLGQLAAGQLWTGKPVEAGEAIQIMTGAPIPAGADAVVMIEHTVRSAATVSVAPGRTLSAGENIVPQGKEARRGAQLVAPGARIGAAEIALAAACGAVNLAVFAQPEAAIIATGDELVELDKIPGPQQIRNSNSYALAAMVEQAGGKARQLAVARDRTEDIRTRIEEGRSSGLLLLSGGVSMGEYDLVEGVLAELNAEFFFTGVEMQPGRPVVFGRLPESGQNRECFFFGLPGNPISTQVTFHCFVEPFLCALGGETAAQPRFVQATLQSAEPARQGVTRLLPARREGVQVRVVGWQGSGDLAANARANCYAELLPGREYTAGDVIRVLER